MSGRAEGGPIIHFAEKVVQYVGSRTYNPFCVFFDVKVDLKSEQTNYALLIITQCYSMLLLAQPMKNPVAIVEVYKHCLVNFQIRSSHFRSFFFIGSALNR